VPLAAIVVTYIISSISFPYWVARANGVDLALRRRAQARGSNLAKSVGLAQGILGGTLDGAKGFLAVDRDARHLDSPVERCSWRAASAALVGQMWPAFHQSTAGAPTRPAGGFALAADPIAAVIMGCRSTSALLAVRLVHPRPSSAAPSGRASCRSHISGRHLGAGGHDARPSSPASSCSASIVLRRISAGSPEGPRDGCAARPRARQPGAV
jgi:glycerol-3-phosphate acyltransferase PlsY